MLTAIQPLARDVSDAVRSSQAVSSPAQAVTALVDVRGWALVG